MYYIMATSILLYYTQVTTSRFWTKISAFVLTVARAHKIEGQIEQYVVQTSIQSSAIRVDLENIVG